MTRPHGRQLRAAGAWPVVLASAALLTATVFVVRQSPLAAQPAARFEGPTSSQPLALSASGEFLVAANPDNNSVSFFDLRADSNRRVATVPVQIEPKQAHSGRRRTVRARRHAKRDDGLRGERPLEQRVRD
jgi:hypothetical protein